MRKIDPLIVDNKALLNAVIEMRHNPMKSILTSNQKLIETDYDLYDFNKYSLERMTPDVKISALKDCLHGCYKSGKIIDKIKMEIKENIPKGIKGRCLYCMISEPSTLDHYLDKSEFPEFSIYTDNLLPICAKCNSLKGDKWIDGNTRLFINNYFDEMISGDYLYIDIGLSSDAPFVEKVRLDFTGVSATGKQIELVKSHYKKLDLLDRYRDKAADLLDTIVEELIGSGRKSISNCQTVLDNRCRSYIKNNGSNHWEAAVCKGILNNHDVMKWLSS